MEPPIEAVAESAQVTVGVLLKAKGMGGPDPQQRRGMRPAFLQKPSTAPSSRNSFQMTSGRLRVHPNHPGEICLQHRQSNITGTPPLVTLNLRICSGSRCHMALGVLTPQQCLNRLLIAE